VSQVGDIVHEQGGFWVRRVKPRFYEVYRNTAVASERVASISHADDGAALRRAISECDRRAAA
jgi:hypothetical protein